MYEATDLMLRRRPLQTDVPALIWQIGNLESRLHTERVSRPERFERFVDYLLQYYTLEHPVIAVYAPPHPLMPATILRFPLHAMPQYAERLHAGYSLYVPATGPRAIQDVELLSRIDSQEHLRAITR